MYCLNNEEHRNMMNSRLVKAYLHPSYPGEDREARNLKEKFNSTGFQVKDYVGYWVFKNGDTRPVPIEVAYFACFIGIGINIEAQKAILKKTIDEELRRYRRERRNHKYSGEELYEMRAAFGSGTTVVDVITGQRIRL